jgi:hypothetical protein
MAKNNTLDQEIQSRIQSFLTELSELVKMAALGSVHAALGGEPGPVQRRGPGRPRGSGKRGLGRPPKAASAKPGRRGRRSEDLEAIAARVLAHVKANPGARLEEIGRGLKTDTGILKRPVAKLLEAKQLRTEGQKRGTKYFAGGGRGVARKAKASKGRKAKRARKASSKRATRRAAKAKVPAAPAAVAA